MVSKQGPFERTNRIITPSSRNQIKSFLGGLIWGISAHHSFHIRCLPRFKETNAICMPWSTALSSYTCTPPIGTRFLCTSEDEFSNWRQTGRWKWLELTVNHLLDFTSWCFQCVFFQYSQLEGRWSVRHFDTLFCFKKVGSFFPNPSPWWKFSSRCTYACIYIYNIYNHVCVCRVFFATELRDHVKSLIDHVATDPRYMLIEAAEGGCLEDAPWCWTNIAEKKHAFNGGAFLLWCLG